LEFIVVSQNRSQASPCGIIMLGKVALEKFFSMYFDISASV